MKPPTPRDTLCRDLACPSRDHCHRGRHDPDGSGVYGNFACRPGDDSCGYYLLGDREREWVRMMFDTMFGRRPGS